MQAKNNALFGRAGLRPDCRGGTYAERIAATLDLPADRVAQIMASGGRETDGFNFAVFDNMRGDHLEILRLLYHRESLTDVVLKIRRELNPRATVSAVRQTGAKYLAAFKAAVAAGRISATPSASTLQPVSRDDFGAGRKTTSRRLPQPEVAENIPFKNKLAEASATVSQPVGHPQPPSVSHPAELPATHTPWWLIRPDFSHPSAGQVSHRPASFGQSATRPAGAGQ